MNNSFDSSTPSGLSIYYIYNAITLPAFTCDAEVIFMTETFIKSINDPALCSGFDFFKVQVKSQYNMHLFDTSVELFLLLPVKL